MGWTHHISYIHTIQLYYLIVGRVNISNPSLCLCGCVAFKYFHSETHITRAPPLCVSFFSLVTNPTTKFINSDNPSPYSQNASLYSQISNLMSQIKQPYRIFLPLFNQNLSENIIMERLSS